MNKRQAGRTVDTHLSPRFPRRTLCRNQLRSARQAWRLAGLRCVGLPEGRGKFGFNPVRLETNLADRLFGQCVSAIRFESIVLFRAEVVHQDPTEEGFQ